MRFAGTPEALSVILLYCWARVCVPAPKQCHWRSTHDSHGPIQLFRGYKLNVSAEIALTLSICLLCKAIVANNDGNIVSWGKCMPVWVMLNSLLSECLLDVLF